MWGEECEANAHVNRRLPAKLVDVLLDNQLGSCAKARCGLYWLKSFLRMRV